jgi:two-component system phosphate regulon response regulator PhoB
MAEEKAKKKILIIEDDEYIGELLNYLFDLKDGFETTIVADGMKACETAREIMPDIVFLDYMLPNMDGLEICRRLKRKDQTKQIPVVLMSSSAQLNDSTGRAAGADYFIAKPFTMTDVLNIIESLKARG